MLVWLSGNLNSKTAPNENYGRELMELFTLGADRRRLQREGRPRAGTRADRLDESPDRARSATTTSATTRAATTRHEDDLRQERRRTSGRTRAGCACATATTPPSSCASSGSYFIPVAPSRVDRSPRCRSCTRAKYEVRPVVEAILKHRRSTPRRAWSSRRSSTPPACCARTGRGIDSQHWFRLSALAGQRLFYPPNVAGWDETRWLDTATFRGRWNLAAFALRPSALDPKRDTAPAERRASSSRARRRSRAPRAHAGDAPRPARLCPAHARRRDRGRRTGDGRERAAPADRDLPGGPGGMTERRACGCNDFSRTELARRAVAEAGRGLPADRAAECRCPPARGSAGGSFLSRAAGLALAVYGGTRLGFAGIRRRNRPRRSDTVGRRCSISIFLDGGADALSILFPDGDPRYRVLRPKLALPASSGIDVQRGRAPALAPVPGLAGDAPRRGQGHGHAGDRLRRARISPTSPRATTGRSARPTRCSAPAGSAATSTASGTQDNPLQGLSLFTRLQPSLATSKVPVASIDGPDRYSLTTQKVDGAVAEQMVQTLGPLGSAHERSKDTALSAAGRITSQSYRLRDAAPAVRARQQPDELRQLGHLSDLERPVPAPDGRAGRDARDGTPAALRHARGTGDVRHPRAAGRRAQRLARADRGHAARVPARPRVARARRPGARPRLDGVRPAREGERVARDRPRRGRAPDS